MHILSETFNDGHNDISSANNYLFSTIDLANKYKTLLEYEYQNNPDSDVFGIKQYITIDEILLSDNLIDETKFKIRSKVNG